MAVIKYIEDINVTELSKILSMMGIEKLNIFSINLSNKIDYEAFVVEEHSTVRYIELGVYSFIDLLNNQSELFFN